MPLMVVNGAQLACTMGMAPGVLTVLPANMVTNGVLPMATIMDSAPIVNIGTFAMCQSPANPMVAVATAAAMGVLTPMPCIPATTAPWVPGDPMVTYNNLPALTAPSTCNCLWMGVISITNPGTTNVTDK